MPVLEPVMLRTRGTLTGVRGSRLRRFTPAMICLGILLMTGCSRNAPPPVPTVQTLGDVRATLTTLPAAPHTGDDTLIVTLTDPATNLPIGDANLTAKTISLAPRLPGASTTGRAQGNGVYNIPIRLAIASRYVIELQVQRIGRPPVTFSFPLDVAQ